MTLEVGKVSSKFMEHLGMSMCCLVVAGIAGIKTSSVLPGEGGVVT